MLTRVPWQEPETTVTLLKPETNNDGEKLFPIKLKLTSGQQFYVATLTKKDRKVPPTSHRVWKWTGGFPLNPPSTPYPAD